MVVPVRLNGFATNAILDTGADVVAISRMQARQFGLDPAKRPFLTTVSTANGDTAAARIALDVAVGDASLKNVPAVILNSDLALPRIGMSFLQKFKAMEFHDDAINLYR
jgi:aspartyl protease family protein